jgi:hypothetical protein
VLGVAGGGEGGRGECWYELRDNGAAFSKYQTLQPDAAAFSKYQTLQPDAWKKGDSHFENVPRIPWSFSQGSCRPFLSLNLSFSCPADAKRSLFLT